MAGKPLRNAVSYQRFLGAQLKPPDFAIQLDGIDFPVHLDVISARSLVLENLLKRAALGNTQITVPYGEGLYLFE